MRAAKRAGGRARRRRETNAVFSPKLSYPLLSLTRSLARSSSSTLAAAAHTHEQRKGEEERLLRENSCESTTRRPEVAAARTAAGPVSGSSSYVSIRQRAFN